MAYEIQVSATNYNISSNSIEYSVTVSSPATANFTITNNLSTVTITKLDTTASIYTDAVELVLADLNDFWQGEWSPGNYTRGDIVTYQYSQYFLDDFDIDPLAVYNSTTPPSQDSTWIRFNWHEAPFAVLTVTNTATFNNNVNIGGNLAVSGDLSIGGGAGGNGLTINSTATFNGRTFFNGTATFNSGISLPNSDLELSSITLNGKNFVRTKTTGTSTLKIGVTNNELFTNSPANTVYTNGSITDRADQVIFGYINNTDAVNPSKQILRRQHFVAGVKSNISSTPNLVIANTWTSRIVANANYPGSAGNEDPSQKLNDWGYVNKWFGGQTQEVAVTNAGTNTLTNFIHLTRDGTEIRSYSGNGSTFQRLASEILVQDTKIDLNALPISPFPTSDILYPVATIQVTRDPLNPTRLGGEINTTATMYRFMPYLSPQENSTVHYAFMTPRYALTPSAYKTGGTFSIGNSKDNRTIEPGSADSIFYAEWSNPSTSTVSRIELKPNRLFIQPSQYAWVTTPYVEFRDNSELRLSAVGVRFNDNSVQTTAWEGYDQGPLSSPIPSLQMRRGTQAQILSYVPEEGELVYAINTNKLFVGDGVTAGGIVVSGETDQPLYTTSSVTFNALTVTNVSTFSNGIVISEGNIILQTAVYSVQNIVSLNTTATQTILEFNHSNNKSVKFIAQITDNGSIHFTEVSVITDGTDTWKVEYGTNTNNGVLGTFSTEITGTQCLIKFTPISPTNMNVRLASILMST